LYPAPSVYGEPSVFVVGGVQVVVVWPSAATQVSVYCTGALTVTCCVPLAAFVPVQPPEAVHELAPVTLHVSVDV
jgi:hypothetical protein